MATTHRTNFEVGLTAPLPGNLALGRSQELRADDNRTDRPSPELSEELCAWPPAEANGSGTLLQTRWSSAAAAIYNTAREASDPISKLVAANMPSIKLALADCKAAIAKAEELPHVIGDKPGAPVPRSFAIALAYMRPVNYEFAETSLEVFLAKIQEVTPLETKELWNLKPFIEFLLLEQIGSIADEIRQSQSSAIDADEHLSALLKSLIQISGTDWKVFFERVSLTEKILRLDPQQVYGKLDYDTREEYRACIAELASRSNCSESEVALRAVTLSGLARRNRGLSESEKNRRTHVGYYLVDGGRDELRREIGYEPSTFAKIQDTILEHPTRYYLAGVGIVSGALLIILSHFLNAWNLGFIALALLLPLALECGVVSVNLVANRIFPPKKLPKVDFSAGVPSDCATAVVVPALLSSEKQVRLAVQGLEVRFLANRDTNLHFVLLTDLPDANQQFDERERLVALCSNLIQKLDQKYATENRGRLFHFHRNRTYNRAEQVWMGWERKRGKLLEFNRFVLNQDDAFAVKTGEWSLLRDIRYVITLDIDTQLPLRAAQRLVGALAHPLNRAAIDPDTNTVVGGYGILQPRVDISIKSASRSRLAALLSGETGFDIYTRAVSDVYQDLFGEAIFTGKGIYEVATFQKVLEHRFPNNRVLSHDLIEGVYARTGLLSDVEVVDDYPSHFSAFSRRKHRWVRGDWQILFSLFPRVPNYFGHFVRNPLNHISRWKIFDNLRRSLMEFAVLLVLLYGWIFAPQEALRWTLAALCVMLFPALMQSALGIVTAGRSVLTLDFWRNLCADFISSLTRVGVRLALLCQQSLIDLDAIVRTVVRMNFTHKRLLEWETAADAEIALGRETIVDIYMKYSLALTAAIASIILLRHSQSFLVALPFLVIWASAMWICEWLNQPQRPPDTRIENSERGAVRRIALRTWRFFREFSNAEENWLIPDFVQEQPAYIAHRISPTNLGLLLNARQAAHDLGFITTEEFVRDTEKTLDTVRRMPRWRGHLYNWYMTDTLQPVPPLFVSTVDSGNLLCSLWTLRQGCLELARQPLLRPVHLDGIRDHVELLVEALSKDCPASEWASAVRDMRQRIEEISAGRLSWIDGLRAMEMDVTVFFNGLSKLDVDVEISSHARELSIRVTSLLKMLESLAPWLEARFQEACPLTKSEMRRLRLEVSLESIPTLYAELLQKLSQKPSSVLGDPAAGSGQQNDAHAALQNAIRGSRDLAARLTGLAETVQSLADEMDFSFLFDQKKCLFSIGYNEAEGGISKYNYDLLASEARTAVFIAIAKGQAPPESWFQLKRSFNSYLKEDVLLSWSGTAFEYLMPCLWMKTFPNTLLDRSIRAAVRAQQKFANESGIPWGMSECSCIGRTDDGYYIYHAFGVSGLAMHTDDHTGDLVVAPYATFLSLMFDPVGAAANLRKMVQLGCLSRYGFYEAVDYTPGRISGGKPEVVPHWMAHHQGMSLVAAANALCDASMQRRFHAEPSVAAVERLLHERFPRSIAHEDNEAQLAAAATVAPPNFPESAAQSGLAALGPNAS